MQSLSLIASGWLSVQSFPYDSRNYAIRGNLGSHYHPRQLFSVENHIAHLRLPILSEPLTDCFNGQDYKTWALRQALAEGPDKLYDLVTARFAADSPVMTAPRELLYRPPVDLCLVKSNIGEIAFPVDFDSLANAFVMAAQGAMIEIRLEDGPCPAAATLDVRRPHVAPLKRVVPLAPKTPAGG